MWYKRDTISCRGERALKYNLLAKSGKIRGAVLRHEGCKFARRKGGLHEDKTLTWQSRRGFAGAFFAIRHHTLFRRDGPGAEPELGRRSAPTRPRQRRRP